MWGIRGRAQLALAFGLLACGKAADEQPDGGSPGGAAGEGGIETGGGSGLGVGGVAPLDGLFDASGGLVAVGGASTSAVGGAVTGASANGGGTSTSGGASTGGYNGMDFTPCETGTFDADVGPGKTCVPWKSCKAGGYVQYSGTSSSDRGCAVCAEGTYSNEENAYACKYGGCLFGELPGIPGTSTIPSTCKEDPDFEGFVSPFGSQILGLTSEGDTAYFTLNTYPGYNQVTVFSYKSGVQIAKRRLQLGNEEIANASTTGPSGAVFLSTHSLQDTALRGWPAAGSAWTDTVTTPSFNYGYLAGSDSHVIAVGMHWADDPLPEAFELVKATQAGSEKTSVRRELPLTYVTRILADGAEGLWLAGEYGDGYRLVRMDSIDLTAEIAQDLAPGPMVSTIPFAVSADGRAYTCVPSGEGLEVTEFGTDADELRAWSLAISGFMPTAIDVLPDQALYLAGTHERGALVVRLALTDGALEQKHFIGSGYDGTGYLTVTDDGTVYIAGGQYIDNAPGMFVRKAF